MNSESPSTTGGDAPREAMEFDLVVVGAGSSGLGAAIRLKQLAPEASACVVEKGGEVGAQVLSGAVLEPRALNELLLDWKAQGARWIRQRKRTAFSSSAKSAR
jgi:electron-transferring-flavoprotein dehydrogenase